MTDCAPRKGGHPMDPKLPQKPAGRAAFAAVRIATPSAFSTRPFLFRRSKMLANQWTCNPFPEDQVQDIKNRDVANWRFTLAYEPGLGWLGCVEMRGLTGLDDWIEIEAGWFPDMRQAVDLMRRQHAHIFKTLQAGRD